MSKINSMMDVGRRSMQNSSTALQTVSHNIANKNTKGFSRQRVDFETNEPIGLGKTRMGMGARPGKVSRINNEYLEKQIQKETGNLGYSEGRSEALGRVEQVYNEQVNKGLNRFMSEFFNSYRELGNNPESLATRTLVKETADFLTKDFARVDSQLSEIQSDVDFQMVQQVEEINQMTKEIASLNQKVQLVTMQGGPANDERDRRDLLVKELGEKINIRYAESDDGALSVTAGSSAVLVSGHSQRDLMASATTENGDKREGNFDILYKPTEKGSAVKVTEQINGGKLGGLLEVRDKVINEFRGEIDQMAFTFSAEVNKAHGEGFTMYDQKGGRFFKKLNSVAGASQNIKVEDHILADVGHIVSSGFKQSPGDNSIANIISSLQYKSLMGAGSATMDEHYNSMVGKVGVMASRANSEVASQGDIVKQLSNIRESISGVNLDEETTKMIEFQKSFDASARLIRTADEMMDTVINLKRY